MAAKVAVCIYMVLYRQMEINYPEHLSLALLKFFLMGFIPDFAVDLSGKT